MKPAISIVLDTRRALNKGPHKGLFPIKLKATFQVIVKGQKKWVPKYFPLDIYCSEKDYERAKGNSRNSELKAISNKMIEAQAKANAIRIEPTPAPTNFSKAKTVLIFNELVFSSLSIFFLKDIVLSCFFIISHIHSY